MTESNQQPPGLMMILEEMSHDSGGTTSALSKLGKLLYSIPIMNAREIAVLWHLLEVCRPNANTPQSKEVVRAVRTALWARMRQIIFETALSKSWESSDVSQITEIMNANGTKKKKQSLLQRILKAA